MPLQYTLLENHLTDNPDDYTAMVQNLRSRSLNFLIDLIITRGSTVTKTDIISVLEDYTSVIEQCLRDGDGINTELLNIAPSIKGVFFSPDEPFDAARHQVRFNLRPGVRLKQVEAQVQLERVSPTLPRPEVRIFEDIASDTRNDEVTPGGLGTLSGTRLKYEPNDPQQGIFFIDSALAATRVTMISLNKPKSLHFQIPATLATGAYTLEVRATMPGASDVRAGSLPHTLQVP